MKTFDWRLAPRFEQLLSARERELCAVLGSREDMLAHPGEAPEVHDFKDAATADSLAAVDAAQAERAALELEEVLAARQRLRDHTFGACVDCGNAIPLARLTALPATAHCAPCQAQHEQAKSPSGPASRLH